jgi:hypothetical protein
MNALLSLWLPILLAAVVVFIISSLIHMVIKWHASDYGFFTNEDAIRDAIRAANPAPGGYVIPQCKEMKNMSSPEMQKKYQEGPVGHITIVANGAPNMGKYLGLWFVWSLVIAAVAALLATRLIPLEHASAVRAAKFVGAVTFIAHGFGTMTESIWMGRPWSSSVKNILDAALYGAGSGLVFLWLWY